MNVEDALQMCGAASVDFTGGEWCYAANTLAEEVERLRAQVYAANLVTAALDDTEPIDAIRQAIYMGDRGQPCVCSEYGGKCYMHAQQERAEAALTELAAGSSAAGRRSAQDADGSLRSVGERQGRQPAADTSEEVARLQGKLQEAREVIGLLIECPNADAPYHSGCSFCAAWQVEQAVAWIRDSYPASRQGDELRRKADELQAGHERFVEEIAKERAVLRRIAGTANQESRPMSELDQDLATVRKGIDHGGAPWSDFPMGDTYDEWVAALDRIAAICEEKDQKLAIQRTKLKTVKRERSTLRSKVRDSEALCERQREALDVADQLAEWARVTTSVDGVFSNNLGAQAQAQGMANLVTRYVAARAVLSKPQEEK